MQKGKKKKWTPQIFFWTPPKKLVLPAETKFGAPSPLKMKKIPQCNVKNFFSSSAKKIRTFSKHKFDRKKEREKNTKKLDPPHEKNVLAPLQKRKTCRLSGGGVRPK